MGDDYFSDNRDLLNFSGLSVNLMTKRKNTGHLLKINLKAVLTLGS